MSCIAQEMSIAHQWIFYRLWNSPDATPEEILAAIGPRGEELFVRGGDLITFMLGGYNGRPVVAMLPEEYTPPRQFSITDGVVTLVPLPVELQNPDPGLTPNGASPDGV